MSRYILVDVRETFVGMRGSANATAEGGSSGTAPAEATAAPRHGNVGPIDFPACDAGTARLPMEQCKVLVNFKMY